MIVFQNMYRVLNGKNLTLNDIPCLVITVCLVAVVAVVVILKIWEKF